MSQVVNRPFTADIIQVDEPEGTLWMFKARGHRQICGLIYCRNCTFLYQGTKGKCTCGSTDFEINSHFYYPSILKYTKAFQRKVIIPCYFLFWISNIPEDIKRHIFRILSCIETEGLNYYIRTSEAPKYEIENVRIPLKFAIASHIESGYYQNFNNTLSEMMIRKLFPKDVQ